MSWFGEESPVIVKTALHICQGNVTAPYYLGNVTEPIVGPYARRHVISFIFQDDSARTNLARVVQDHLQFHRISALPWPAKSPDLSPI